MGNAPSNRRPNDPVTTKALTKISARSEMGDEAYLRFNFGVVGATGAGKSTLINSIRGLATDHPHAARVDEVQCTQERRAYSFPNGLERVRLWDFPGAGTTEHPEQGYFEKEKLYAMNELFIVFAERLRKIDVTIAQNAAEYHIPYHFVRTKADQAIDNKVRRRIDLVRAKKELRTQALEAVNTELRRFSLSTTGVMCVSETGFTTRGNGEERYSMDEEELMTTIKAGNDRACVIS